MGTQEGKVKVTDPQKAFVDPQYLVDAKGLPEDEKIRLLLDWRQDLLELQTASEENMPGERGEAGGVATRLKAVTDALIALGHESE